MNCKRWINILIKDLRYCLLFITSLATIANASMVYADDITDRIGYAEFRLHCAVCHGRDGMGAGSIAGLLNVTADQLDLSKISERNNKIYPFRKVFEIIDGRQNISAHGERLMPIWGERYSIQASEKYGPYGSESVIRGRILELVYFINGIQRY